MSDERLPLWKHLLPWVAVPVVEVLLDRASFPRHTPVEVVLELGGFLALGSLQWRLAREAWLRTLLWPALLPLLGALGVAGPNGRMLWIVFYAAGLVLLTTSVLRDLAAKRGPGFLVATVLAVCSALGARAVDLWSSFSDNSARFGGQGGEVVARLAAELTGSTAGRGTRTSGGADGPPVVIVSVDTLRADAARTMKSYERLAARGAWWDSAMSTSSWTMPAVASLQTGEPPSVHGAACLVGGRCQGLAASVPTLAEDLRARGYTTAAVTANPRIGATTGLDRGFAFFRDQAGIPPARMLMTGHADAPHPQDGAVLVDAAIEWLSTLAPAGGFYLWVHLLGPHMPYSHSDDGAMRAVDGARLRTGAPPTERFRDSLRAAYDGEVAYNDRELGRLLDALEARGVLERGIVVLTSDHGEEFWEHGGVEHGHSHVHEVTEVPLVVVAPGLAAGRRSGTASLLDVASTVRASVGLATGGVDLRRPLAADRVAAAWGNLYLRQQKSARDEASRVIVTEGPSGEVQRAERFDRLGDGDERTPTQPQPGDRVLEAALAERGPAEGEAAGVNAEALRALGYVAP